MTFDEAYERFYASVQRYCYYRNGRNLYYAQEAASEAFLVLLQKWEKIRSHEEKYIASWLFGTAKNKMKEIHRKSPQNVVSLDDLPGFADDPHAAEPVDRSEEEDHKFYDYMQEIEKRLLPVDRVIFHSLVVDGLTYQDIAQAMQMSVNAVKLRWLRMKVKIRPIINELFHNM